VRRRGLAAEAIWLGRLIASLSPPAPEAIGLLALMLYAEARRATRRDIEGEYVPLAEQDPSRWDHAMIGEAETLLRRAGAMRVVGRFQLEAAIQSAHVVRRQTGRADWMAIEQLYAVLASMTDSPVVTINRAIAVAETRGAAAGLELLDTVSGDSRVAEYQPYWAARAGLLARAGRITGADDAYRRAIGLEPDPAVRRFLMTKRAGLPKPDDRRMP
jgi:RNA polymerase sigma-70 factor (ECF subfamily)